MKVKTLDTILEGEYNYVKWEIALEMQTSLENIRNNCNIYRIINKIYTKLTVMHRPTVAATNIEAAVPAATIQLDSNILAR